MYVGVRPGQWTIGVRSIISSNSVTVHLLVWLCGLITVIDLCVWPGLHIYKVATEAIEVREGGVRRKLDVRHIVGYVVGMERIHMHEMCVLIYRVVLYRRCSYFNFQSVLLIRHLAITMYLMY